MATQKLKADTAKQTLRYGPFALIRASSDAVAVNPAVPS